jgi:hypothetical protein
MAERTEREQIERFIDLMNQRAWDRLGEVLHPEFVEDWPQSGERIRGIVNMRAVREQYPGGALDVVKRDLVGAEDEWVLTPAYTTVRVIGTSDQYTLVLRTRYPDGSDWFLVCVLEFKGGLIARMTTYFAPDFPAPDWRAPFRETIPPA